MHGGHGRKEVTVTLDSLQDLRSRELQGGGIAGLQATVDLGPGYRGRNRGMWTSPQGVNGDSRLVFVVLAPINEDFTFAKRLLHVAHD